MQLLRYNYASGSGILWKNPSVRVMHLHKQCRMVDEGFVRDHYGAISRSKAFERSFEALAVKS